ncbi:SDR family NAD(P)-dependent oxidoreductase [Mycoplasma sp. P36-A1]|uniref:SDR family NAD(P)-dependent oxidoreductase n=1 Tax=Mycoplasma sp. P36-A1 TaxID=3252900 RepID=UPI003C30A045
MNNYKIALVTGATGGIGGAIARNLANNGMKLVLTGRNSKKLAAITSELKDAVLYSEAIDMSDYKQIEAFVSNIYNEGINIDTLVNNAGLALGLSSIDQSDLSDIMTMVDVNVKSLMILTTLISSKLKEQNHGIIINIGSTAGQVAYANGAVYCATKAAVKTFADGVRVDLMESDVKVTTIMPGMVETDFSLARFKGDQEKADNVYKGIDALQAIDVAEAVWFVINQPKRCVISELALLANQQGNGFTSFKK